MTTAELAARAKDLRRQVQEFAEALRLHGTVSHFGPVKQADEALRRIQFALERDADEEQRSGR